MITMKPTIKTLIFTILFLFSAWLSFAETNDFVDIAPNLEYTFLNDSFDESTIDTIKQFENDVWIDFISIESLTKKINNSKTVWFRVQVPNLEHHNQGIFFDDFRANSIEIYLDSELVYTRHRDWIYNHNNLLFPISSVNTHLIYIKTDIVAPNIGPANGIFLGNFIDLEQTFLSKNIDNLYIGFITLIVSALILVYSLMNFGNNTNAGLALSIVSATIGSTLLFYCPIFLSLYPDLEHLSLAIFDSSIYLSAAALVYFLHVITNDYNTNFLEPIASSFIAFAFILSTLLISNHIFNFLAFDQYIFISAKIMGIFLVLAFLVIIFYSMTVKANDFNVILFRFSIFIFSMTIALEILLSMTTNYIYTPVLWKYSFVVFVFLLLIILMRLFTYNKSITSNTPIPKNNF